MIGCRYLIVTICFNALHRIVRIVVELIQHHLIEFVINRHRLLSRKESFRSFILHLLEPSVNSNFINTVTFIWIGIQNFCQKMSTVLGKELWYFEIARKDLFI